MGLVLLVLTCQQGLLALLVSVLRGQAQGCELGSLIMVVAIVATDISKGTKGGTRAGLGAHEAVICHRGCDFLCYCQLWHPCNGCYCYCIHWLQSEIWLSGY